MIQPFHTQNKIISNIHLSKTINHRVRTRSSTKLNSKDNSWDFLNSFVVRFRVCKFRITDDVWIRSREVLVTNLDVDKFPLDRMKELYTYVGNWEVFKTLKYDDCGIQFHSQERRVCKDGVVCPSDCLQCDNEHGWTRHMPRILSQNLTAHTR